MDTKTEPNELNDGTWRLELNRLEKFFYSSRDSFYHAVRRYYYQNPYGTYVDEDKLIEQIKELQKLRNQMKQITEENFVRTNYKETFFESGVLFDER